MPVTKSVTFDPRTVEATVAANERLVFYVLGRRGTQLEREDAEQIGRLALTRAAQLFDASRGFCFSTYAVRAIYQNLARAERERGLIREWEMPAPDLPEGVDIGALADPNCPDPEESAVGALWLDQLLGTLPPEDRRVIGIRFGLETGDPATLAETARRLGVSRTTAQRRQDDALARLREVARAYEEGVGAAAGTSGTSGRSGTSAPPREACGPAPR